MVGVASRSVITTTEASRNFATFIERAKAGESFVVTKNGIGVAQIVPPPSGAGNGQAVIDAFAAWEGGAITDGLANTIAGLRDHNSRDTERLAWVDESR